MCHPLRQETLRENDPLVGFGELSLEQDDLLAEPLELCFKVRVAEIARDTFGYGATESRAREQEQPSDGEPQNGDQYAK